MPPMKHNIRGAGNESKMADLTLGWSRLTISNVTTRHDGWQTLATGLWFGIAAGLAERAAYKIVPGYLGPVELWYSALLDLIAFTALGLIAILISRFARKLRASTIAIVLCSILLALDCVTIFVPPYNKLLSLSIGVVAGALLAFPLVKFELSKSWLARTSLLVGMIYAFSYLAVLPGWRVVKEY